MNHIHNVRIIAIAFTSLFIFSCERFESEISLGEYRITYEVETEYGSWYGTYRGSAGDSCVCDKPYQPSGWTHTFSTNEIPNGIFIEASSEFYGDTTRTDIPDITANIYINGELVNSQVNSIAEGKTRSSASASEIPSF